jgi:DNA-3-methyladenine glycosylase
MKKKIDDSSPGRIVPHSFFNRKTLAVARELIGKTIARETGGKIIRQKITETKAYVGPHDLACHSARGKTERNKIMFCEAGTIYVYFTYGMHWMLNIVTEEKDFPAAVLIRGTIEVTGPARLTKALQIDKSLNGLKLGKKSGLWIEDDSRSSRAPGARRTSHRISRTPRIGVEYAKDGWAEKPYRFLLKD